MAAAAVLLRFPKIKPARGIIELFLVCGALMAVVYGTALYSGYQQHVQSARSVAQRMTNILAEHAQQTLRGAAAAALHVGDEVEEHGLAAVLASDDMWHRIATFAATPSQLQGVMILDAAARPVRVSTPDISLTPEQANELIARHGGKEPSTRIDRIGPDARGAFDLVASRAIRGADDALAGVAIVFLEKGYFRNFYRMLELGPAGVIGIIWDDGNLLLREPAPPSWPQSAKNQLSSVTGEGLQRIDRISPVDGRERLLTVNLLPEVPIRVYTAVAMDDVLGVWRASLRVSVPVAAVVGLALAALAWLLWRAAAREEQLVGALEQALTEKNLLFQEIHHRVKNNLQVVSSLVAMETSGLADDRAKASLTDLVGRISSISQVHEVLYRHDEADAVEVEALLLRLCRAIAAYHKAEGRIALRVDADCRLDLRRAIPLALVANEVVANAFKHAFPDGRGGAIGVSCRTVDGRHILRIHDDGVGIDAAAMSKDTLGTRLVASLVAQLGGVSSTSVDSGTAFELSFPA